jgi:hypothetical protein
VTAALERAQEYGSSSSKTDESQKTKVDVTISGAPPKANGANGNYTLHPEPLSDQNIRYYQGIKDDGIHMFIIYSEKDNQWQITSDKPTLSEARYGIIAYIACKLEDAKKTYLETVSGVKEWYVPATPGSLDGVLAPEMVAEVKSGGESPAASDSSASAAASASPVAAPAAAPSEIDMKEILKSTDTEYTTISTKLKTLNGATVPAEIKKFDDELDTAKANLKGAQDKLDAFRKSKVSPDHIKLTADEEPEDFSGGRSSSSSKKNRKSHKSYHPGIGKTRKHHSHSEPKRISFVHQA